MCVCSSPEKRSFLLRKAFAVTSFGATNIRRKTYLFPREVIDLGHSLEGPQDCHSVPNHTSDAVHFSTRSQLQHSESQGSRKNCKVTNKILTLS